MEPHSSVKTAGNNNQPHGERKCIRAISQAACTVLENRWQWRTASVLSSRKKSLGVPTSSEVFAGTTVSGLD